MLLQRDHDTSKMLQVRVSKAEGTAGTVPSLSSSVVAIMQVCATRAVFVVTTLRSKSEALKVTLEDVCLR